MKKDYLFEKYMEDYTAIERQIQYLDSVIIRRAELGLPYSGLIGQYNMLVDKLDKVAKLL